MKHLSLFGWLSLLFILSTAFTCADHRDQPAPALRFRVKTVNYVKAGGRSVQDGPYVFSYYSNGLLASFSNEGSFEQRFRNVFVFSDGTHAVSTGKYLSISVTVGMYYYFDAQNRIIQIKLYSSPEYKLTHDFMYDGSNTIPSSRITTRIENGVSIGSKTETYMFAGGNATMINGTSFSYDASPNPYKGLFGFNAFDNLSPDFHVFANSTDLRALNRPFNVSENFSDSSVKVFNQNNRTTDAQLSYNSDRLVTKILYKDGNAEEFTYETY
jgi:hypothetical protein